MKGNASKKQPSLLDALDQSFSLSDSPAAPTQLATKLVASNPALPLQNTIDHYFEPSSSSSDNSNVEEQLRIAREVYDARQMSVASGYRNHTPVLLNHAEYIADSRQFASRGAGLSSFNLNYDQETGLREIDRGGPDQEQKFDCSFTAIFSPFSEHIYVYKVGGFRNPIHTEHKPRAFCERCNEKAWTEWVDMRLFIALLWPQLTKACSPQDLLPGLEVRLLNHQAIGVAW